MSNRRVSFSSSTHESTIFAGLAEKFCLSTSQILEYHSAFSVFDKDEDGCVTQKELEAVFQSIGHAINAEHVLDLIQQADTDKNGTIEFEEFIEMIVKQSKHINWNMALKDIFDVLDRNKDGNISASELKYILSNLGEDMSDAEVESMINEVDTDQDGQINFKEFVKMMEC